MPEVKGRVVGDARQMTFTFAADEVVPGRRQALLLSVQEASTTAAPADVLSKGTSVSVEAQVRLPPPSAALTKRAARARGKASPAAGGEWTPDRVLSYLLGLGLDPADVVVGPDMLKLLPFGGVRRVEWIEEHRRARFPLRFLPRWCWEPYFVTTARSLTADDRGLMYLRPWVALTREPGGLRPYWLAPPSGGPGSLQPERPVLPACFLIGAECAYEEPRLVRRAAPQGVQDASVLEEALETLRGYPVRLDMHATGAVWRVVSEPFVLRGFRVTGTVPAGLGAEGDGSVRGEADGGFGFEVDAVRHFRVYPGRIIIDSCVPGVGWYNTISLCWERAGGGKT